jgi:hypothetical protein
MKKDESKTDSGFLRQRRNLFIISIGLLLFQAFELELKKINFLGNEFGVSRPEFIPASLWIIYIYYVVRYYQFFYETNRGVKEKIGEYTKVVLSKIRIKKAKWMIIRELGLKIFKYKLKYSSTKEHLSNEWLDVSTVMFQAIITTKEKDKNNNVRINSKTTGFQKDVEIQWKGFLFIRFQTFLHVCFRTSLITEYYIPFVVATFPCLWYLFAKYF